MISQIFKTGGGAGIGSYVIVFKNGELLKPSAEKIRWAYDSGENLFLSIIDDSTEEALLPLTGYVDNDDVLHLSGRDFDDNLTYQFSINGKSHEIETEIVEGITLGEGTVGDNSNFTVYEYDLFAHTEEEIQILTPEQMADIWEKQYDVVKVNAHMGGEEPGSYDPGSYEPEETIVRMVFVKTQVIEDVLMCYTTGVDSEKAIIQLIIMNEGGEFVYHLEDIDLSSGHEGEIQCENLSVSNSAYTTYLSVGNNFTLSTYPTEFTAGAGYVNFANREGNPEQPAKKLLSFNSNCEDIHLMSENLDYKYDQSNDQRRNAIDFYNDSTQMTLYTTNSGAIDSNIFMTYSVQNNDPLIQGEVSHNGVTSRFVINGDGVKIEKVSTGEYVESVLTLGDQSLSNNELHSLKERLYVTMLGADVFDGSSTQFSISNKDHIESGHYFVTTLYGSNKATVDILVLNGSAEMNYIANGTIITGNGTMSTGNLIFKWDDQSQEYVISLPVTPDNDVHWQVDFLPL